jgi:uncharacterized spore protein YtfJ
MDEKIDTSAEAIQQMLRRMNASTVFGEPVREGGATIIPVASVIYGFGSGSGSGPMQSQGGAMPGTSGTGPGGTGTGGEMMGSGGGGGGGGRAKPIGFIRIDAEGASYEPIMDQTMISVAGIAMAAWSAFWFFATIRALLKRK